MNRLSIWISGNRRKQFFFSFIAFAQIQMRSAKRF
jgi:hypothetical protein